jgi:hypothetical protein
MLSRNVNSLSAYYTAVYTRIYKYITDPSSPQRGRYKITKPQLSKGNFKEKEKLIKGPRWAPDTKTDWPSDCRSYINFNSIILDYRSRGLNREYGRRDPSR